MPDRTGRDGLARGQEPMTTIHNVMNADDLAQSVEELSTEIDRMRRAGPLSFSDAQNAGSSLTRAQLVLNELERVEIRERGVSREIAERFALLDSRIRAIRYELYLDLTNRRPSAADNGGNAPEAAAKEGGGDAHDPAG